MKKKVMSIATALVFAVVGQAQTVPDYINYQGKLMDGTNLYSGTVPITFRLYDAPTGGIFPYCEDSNDVVIVDGLYSTYIGDDVIWGSLDNALIQTQVWIEVEIDGQIILPREPLASVGYARYAAKLPANAVTLDMIAPDAVQFWHIADNQVRGNHLQAGAVSNAHLAANAVASNVIDWANMPAGLQDGDDGETYTAGTGLDLVANEFSIADGGVGKTQIADDAITTVKVDWDSMPFGLEDGDDDTKYTAGSGLRLSGSTFDVTNEIQVKTVPIEALPLAISDRGYYYLTTNLMGSSGNPGILIDSSDVVVDLNGYTMAGNIGTTYGIEINGSHHNIIIKNGVIRDWQSGGIYGPSARDGMISDLALYWNNGDGAFLSDTWTINNCVAATNAGDGIAVTGAGIVSRCVARNNGDNGIDLGAGSVIRACSALANAQNGIDVNGGSLQNCTAYENGWFGIVAVESAVENCTANRNNYDGIWGSCSMLTGCAANHNVESGFRLGSGSYMTDCQANYNGDDGVYINGHGITVKNNAVYRNDYSGIHSSGSSYSLAIEKNTCMANGMNNTDDCAGIWIEGTGNNVIRDNTSKSSRRGIWVTSSSSHSLIYGNVCSANGTNYVIINANRVAPITTLPSSSGISGSSGGSSFTITEPYVNIAH